MKKKKKKKKNKKNKKKKKRRRRKVGATDDGPKGSVKASSTLLSRGVDFSKGWKWVAAVWWWWWLGDKREGRRG